jgi:hypothetical protein
MLPPISASAFFARLPGSDPRAWPVKVAEEATQDALVVTERLLVAAKSAIFHHLLQCRCGHEFWKMLYLWHACDGA